MHAEVVAKAMQPSTKSFLLSSDLGAAIGHTPLQDISITSHKVPAAIPEPSNLQRQFPAFPEEVYDHRVPPSTYQSVLICFISTHSFAFHTFVSYLTLNNTN